LSKHLRLFAVLALLCASRGALAQSAAAQPAAAQAAAQAPAAIIPQPVSVHWQQGQFMLNATTTIVAADSDNPSVKFFNDYLKKLYGLHLQTTSPANKPAANYITLTRTDNYSSPEGSYHLDVTPDHIQITAADGPGIFFGIQTIIQLLPLSPFVATQTGYAIRPAAANTTNPSGVATPAGYAVPAVTIDDYPRF